MSHWARRARRARRARDLESQWPWLSARQPFRAYIQQRTLLFLPSGTHPLLLLHLGRLKGRVPVWAPEWDLDMDLEQQNFPWLDTIPFQLWRARATLFPEAFPSDGWEALSEAVAVALGSTSSTQSFLLGTCLSQPWKAPSTAWWQESGK